MVVSIASQSSRLESASARRLPHLLPALRTSWTGAGAASCSAALTSCGRRAETLSDPTSGVTLFAPDNDGVNQTLGDLGLKLEGLLQDPKLVLSIVQFHVLPSPVEVRAPPAPAARPAARRPWGPAQPAAPMRMKSVVPVCASSRLLPSCHASCTHAKRVAIMPHERAPIAIRIRPQARGA